MPTITAPAKTPGKVSTYFGPYNITFEDGVAEFDGDLPDGLVAYLYAQGYDVDGEHADPVEPPAATDSRDHEDPVVVGSPLRDAAVDPQPEDFLAPVGAGDGDPHGPDVVAPGIHATAPGPIVPGTVGSADYQDGKESAVAEAVLVDNRPATEVATGLGALAKVEYDKTGQDGLAAEVEDNDLADVEKAADDGHQAEPVELKGAALEEALTEAGLPKTGTADEKRQRLAEHRG